MHLSPARPHPIGVGCCTFYGGGSAVFDSLLFDAPIVGFCNCSIIFFVVSYYVTNTSFATTLIGKRELFALLCLSSGCLLIAVWLFLPVPRICLLFVLMVVSDITHYFSDHL